MPASNNWTLLVIDGLVKQLGYTETEQVLQLMGSFNPESNEVTMTVRALKAAFAAYPVPTP